MARTRLKLEHFGEPMVCAILQRLADSGCLGRVQCFSSIDRSPSSLAEALRLLGLADSVRFHDNVPLAQMSCGDINVSFDGLSRIDCLVEDGRQAVGMEVKLGTKRMAATEFSGRFFTACDWSNHVPPRVKGNMIAVLDGRFIQPQLASASLVAEVAGRPSLPVLGSWFLLLRRDVWQKWERNSPTFQRPCQILLLEDLLPAVGGPAVFDEIIRDLVGDEFAASWGLAQ